jgi:urease accessory protein UreF
MLKILIADICYIFKMQHLEVSSAVRHIYMSSLGGKQLMLELNPSVQRCLTRFFTGDSAS